MGATTIKNKKLFTFHFSLFTVRGLFTFHFSLLTLFCFAQQQYTFTNYTQEQGLPSGTIRGIYKDTTGYLWLTSEEGVARFDGYNFKTYRHNPDDSTSLPNNVAWYGAFPQFGDIYFETQPRHCKYNPVTESFSYNLPFGDTLEKFRINEVKSNKDYYWAISKSSIFKITKNGTQQFALPFLVVPYDWKIIASPDNRVLVSSTMVGKPSVLFLDQKTKALSKIKIVNREGVEDTSTFCDVFFAGNNFYLFNIKSAFRFNPTSKTFEWCFDLKHTANFDYAFPPYLSVNDTLVVITSNTGFLNIINLKTGEDKLVYVNKKIPESDLSDRVILSCIADNNDGIWLGTSQMGVIHYNLITEELSQYIHDPGNSNSPADNFVSTILPDESGVIWASSFANGLIKMDPVTPLFKIAVPAAAPQKKFGTGISGQGWSTNIRGFLETDDGHWIATMNGLFGYSNQTHQYSNLEHLCPEAYSTRVVVYEKNLSAGLTFGCLAKDHSGNIWIGPWYGELVIYNPKLQRSFPIRPQALKDRNESVFRNLYCDSKNRMWISTQTAGICMVDCNTLNPEKVNDIKYEYHFPDANDVTAIQPGMTFLVSEDAEGNIWAGTEKGLCRYNEQTKKWKRYVNIPGNEKSIHDSNVRSLCLDKKGTLWIGTNGGGLNRYNKEQDNFSHFTTENGLPNDQIYTLVCDDSGMLWMGTNYGMCRFNPQDYSTKNFTEKDGIQNYEYNTGAALKLKDGTLLIGGVAGYNIIDPNRIENKKAAPPVVVISSFKVFDKEMPTGNNNITLSYRENNLAFEFAALSYSRNQENHYAYMLEGIDHEWILSENRRYVSYPKLPPGHYTFKVKACNSDGVWNETGTQLQITITPPWWLRTWFIIVCFLVAIAILYFINRYEQNRKKQLEAVRSRISRDLHDDMGSTLQSISVMSEIARMKSKSNNIQDSLPMIEKIGSASRDMVDKMNDIVWAVNPQNDNFENIILHMRAFGGELLAGKDIALHFKTDSGLNNIKLSMEKRKSFFLVYKEALNNAFKYSDAKNVNVEITKINHTLKLVVQDDGVGFNTNEDRLKTGGNGLKNMNTRAAELNGNISITSAPRQGTKISLTVNLK